MKKYYQLLTGLMCIAVLTGCVRTSPVLNVQTPVPWHHTSVQVKNAIFEAGQQQNWIMRLDTPGIIDAHLMTRDHRADIRIQYSEKEYRINYVSSQNLRADNGRIHRNYNRWIRKLDHAIQENLQTKLSINPVK